MTRQAFARLIAFFLVVSPAASAPLTVPFDFSKRAIGISATIRGEPVHVILDTGVDPSVVDLRRAEMLGLTVDRTNGGEASGFGEGKGATIFPARVDSLAISGRRFRTFDALASDMSTLSVHYGSKLDAVLGYSFLSDKIVLIDYPGRTLGILARRDEVKAAVRRCRTRWTIPLKTQDSFPVVAGFRLGKARGTISLDTGANGGIGLFRRALNLPGLRASLVEDGTIVHQGARGEARAKRFRLAAPVGFGPFTLPPGRS
ncbi:retropepsin-like aspartic protease [Sphingomonas sp. MMS24-J13]|uniref:retropepsin-like aspartic protease n=1 Tax=Sphingomonas sp. MMS24-J13 TaxID=3238686 RepID=UPI00384AE26B